MRTVSALALVLLLRQDREVRCEHGSRGATREVDLAKLEREYGEFANVSAKWVGRMNPKIALDEPFDSGLPGCRARRTRTIRRTVPGEMVGKTILFAPEGEGIVYVTKARRRKDLFGRLAATPEAARRFDVRCIPTRITVEKDGLVLEENP